MSTQGKSLKIFLFNYIHYGVMSPDKCELWRFCKTEELIMNIQSKTLGWYQLITSESLCKHFSKCIDIPIEYLTL